MATTKKNDKTKDFTSAQGNKYKFQRVLPSKWLDIMDDVDADGTRKRGKLYPAVLEYVVVSPPNLKPDDFEEGDFGGFGELEEVVTAAVRFQQGK